LTGEGSLLLGAYALRGYFALAIWIPVLSNPRRRSVWQLGAAFLAGWIGSGIVLGHALGADIAPSPADLAVFVIARVMFFSTERTAARAAARSAGEGLRIQARFVALAAVEPFFLASGAWLAVAASHGIESTMIHARADENLILLLLVALAGLLVVGALVHAVVAFYTPFGWLLVWSYLFTAAALLSGATCAEHFPWFVTVPLFLLLCVTARTLPAFVDEDVPKLALAALQLASIVIAPIAATWSTDHVDLSWRAYDAVVDDIGYRAGDAARWSDAIALLGLATPVFWLGWFALIFACRDTAARPRAPRAGFDPAIVVIAATGALAVIARWS
jgi:hypothetical protein